MVAANGRLRDEEEEDDEADDTASAATAKFEEVAPERLVEHPKLRALPGAARRFDLDGDGRREFVLTDAQRGGLSIISSDGTEVERLKLKGRRGNCSISAVEPPRIDGKVHWLTAWVKIGYPGGSQQVRVTLHDGEGEPLWSHEPDLPKKVNFTALLASGDLDGDGTLEFVLGLSMYKMRESGRNSWSSSQQRGYLTNLDQQGNISCRRTVRGMYLTMLHVAAPAANGMPATILYGAHDRVLRVQFDSGAIAKADVGTKSDAAIDASSFGATDRN